METQCPDCHVKLKQIIIPAFQMWTENQGTYIQDEQTTGIYMCEICGYDTGMDYSQANN